MAQWWETVPRSSQRTEQGILEDAPRATKVTFPCDVFELWAYSFLFTQCPLKTSGEFIKVTLCLSAVTQNEGRDARISELPTVLWLLSSLNQTVTTIPLPGQWRYRLRGEQERETVPVKTALLCSPAEGTQNPAV